MEIKAFLTELRPCKLSQFGQLFTCLCTQPLPQFSMNLFETLHTLCGHYEDVHVEF